MASQIFQPCILAFLQSPTVSIGLFRSSYYINHKFLSQSILLTTIYRTYCCVLLELRLPKYEYLSADESCSANSSLCFSHCCVHLLLGCSLDLLCMGRTTRVITDRMSTILDSDTVCVIRDSSIVEKGKPFQLLKQMGKYYDLWIEQMGWKETVWHVSEALGGVLKSKSVPTERRSQAYHDES